MESFVDDDYCFACGKQNPIGLGMKVEYGPDRALCRMVIPREYQGWHSAVHGGIISTLLDEIMAHAVLHHVGNAVTARLTVRFRERVPTEEPLDVVGWIESRKKNVVDAKAEIRSVRTGTLMAEGESRFMRAS